MSANPFDRELKLNPQLDPPAKFPGSPIRPVEGRAYFDPKVGLVRDGKITPVESSEARAARLEKYANEREYAERQAGIHRPAPPEAGENVWPPRGNVSRGRLRRGQAQ